MARNHTPVNPINAAYLFAMWREADVRLGARDKQVMDLFTVAIGTLGVDADLRLVESAALSFAAMLHDVELRAVVDVCRSKRGRS